MLAAKLYQEQQQNSGIQGFHVLITATYLQSRVACAYHSCYAGSGSVPPAQELQSLAAVALPVLKLCLKQQPMGTDQVHKMLHVLMPAGGWPLDSPLGSAGSQQQAELAHHLLHQVSF